MTAINAKPIALRPMSSSRRLKVLFLAALVLCLHLTAPVAFAAPTITSQPASQTVTQGANVTLSVAATVSSGALSYQWRKEGLAIPSATGASYSITGMQPWQIGDYTVVVTDAGGSVTSSVAALALTGVPTGVWKGLVGYYPLSGNANDSTAFVRHGTVSGATTTTDRFSQASSAYSFNGASHFISAAAGTPGWPSANADRTVSVWFKTASTTASGNLFAFGARASNQRFSLLFFNATAPAFIGENNDQGYTTASLAGAVWHHCVITYGSNVGKVFMDGVKLATPVSSWTKTLATDGTQPFFLAVNAQQQGEYFAGSLDDARIYNRALSESEVAALYAQENGTSLLVVGNQTIIASGDTTPDSADDTAYGTTPVGTPVTRTFTLRNPNPTAALTIGTVTLTGTGAGQFSITTVPTASIPAGGSTTLGITYLAGASGVHDAVVSIPNSSAGTPSFTFSTGGRTVGIALTDAATSVTNATATLQGTVYPSGASATYYFQYGPDTNYGSFTPTNTLPASNFFYAVNNVISGFTPGITNHYRLVVTNGAGIFYGDDVAFGSPVITLLGAVTLTNECHASFTDPGASNSAGFPVSVNGSVDTNTPGTYTLTYAGTNTLGGMGTATRTVVVRDTIPPVITLLGGNPLTHLINVPFTDPGATALDACGGSVPVNTDSTVNSAVAGTYFVSCSSTDNYGNSATNVRTVVVRVPVTLTVLNLNDSGPGSLRQAVLDAVSGDTITFTSTLSGQTILLTSGQIVLDKNLTLDGSALANGIRIDANNSSRIFMVNSGTTNVLNSLTLYRGRAHGANGAPGVTGGNGFGGGIYNAGTLTVNHCTLTNNIAAGGNAGNGVPGGLGGNGFGGGIYNSGTLTVDHCTLANNSAAGGKGGDSVAANGGTGGLGNGGGIYNSGSLTINHCTVVSGSVQGGNGGNALSVNTNGGNGGNGTGGGIYNGGTLAANHCTLVNNSANGGSRGPGGGGTTTAGSGFGGGIYNGVILNLTNSIVCGNAASVLGPNIQGSISSGANNLVDANALLATLGNYGGPTQTMPPLTGSPAIDAGNDTAASPFATDQRGDGFPRLSGPHVDIGAVEFQYPVPGVFTADATAITSTSATLNGTVNPHGLATTVSFEYGPDTSYGSTASVNLSPNDGTSAQNVSVALSGLVAHTTYHFRVVGANTAGTAYGSDATFTTANTAPTAPNATTAGTTGDPQTHPVTFPATDADGDPVVINAATAVSGLAVNGFTGTSVTFTPASGFTGNASFTYTVSDGFGGTATGTITVAVTDNDAPVVAAHANVGPVEATGASGAVVTYAAGSAGDNIGVTSLTYSPNSGTTFPLGSTPVTLTATDAANLTGTGSFTVTVQDTTPPAISGVPADLTVAATSAAGAVVTFSSPTASDLVDGARTVTCMPASGSTFPLGTTTVTCTASDTRGHSSTATFTVTVSNNPPTDITLSTGSVAENQPAGTLVGTFTATDVDATGTAAFTLVPGAGSDDNASFSLAGDALQTAASFNFEVKDTYRIRVRATDDGGLFHEKQFTITVTDVAENAAPMAAPDSLDRAGTTRTAKILLSALLGNDSDADGDPLTVIAVGDAQPPGTTVIVAGAFALYTAPTTTSGPGSFTYTLSDGPGGHTVTGLVTVNETSPASTSGPNHAAIAVVGNDIVVTFLGVAGRTYRVQFRELPGDWQDATSANHTAAPNGVFTHTDANPNSPMRLYRAVGTP